MGDDKQAGIMARLGASEEPSIAQHTEMMAQADRFNEWEREMRANFREFHAVCDRMLASLDRMIAISESIRAGIEELPREVDEARKPPPAGFV